MPLTSISGFLKNTSKTIKRNQSKNKTGIYSLGITTLAFLKQQSLFY